MNISINQGNVQENITSAIIVKLYEVATAVGNTVELSGNLYSPSGYAYQVDYLNLTFGPNFTLTVPETGKYIYFADSEVERVLKANNVSSDGIGITVNDAADATFISSTFKNNTTMTSFDEFGYFTKPNINPPNELFDGCTNLNTIDTSNTLKISNYEFRSTSNLSYIDFSKVTSIGLFAFDGSGISGDIKINNVSSLGRYAFTNCRNITSIDLSESPLTNIPGGAFLNCSSLLSLKFNPDTMTTYGDTSYNLPINSSVLIEVKGINKLTTAYSKITANLQNAVYLGVYDKEGLPIGIWDSNNNRSCSIKLLYLPRYTYHDVVYSSPYSGYYLNTFCGYRIGGNSNFSMGLIYFKNLLKIVPYMFFRVSIPNVVINNTTPPTFDTTCDLTPFQNHYSYNTWHDKIFGEFSPTIYVPDSAISAYENDTYFGIYTIKGISELTEYDTEDDWEAAGRPNTGIIKEYMN